MAVPIYPNTEEHERLFGDFTKGTKRGRRRCRSAHPAASTADVGGVGAEGKEGDSAPREGPSGQGEGPLHPKGANRAETASSGKARGAAAPLLGSPQNQSSWYPGAETNGAGL